MSEIKKIEDPWDGGMSDCDPVEDFIKAFWVEAPESIPELNLNEFVKRMIPKDRWPEEESQ